MERLTEDYSANVRALSEALAVDESFDLNARRLTVGADELTLFYIDGFVKDGAVQRLTQFFIGQRGLASGRDAARRFVCAGIPYVNVEVASKP